jgi:hypothetical protein
LGKNEENCKKSRLFLGKSEFLGKKMKFQKKKFEDGKFFVIAISEN